VSLRNKETESLRGMGSEMATGACYVGCTGPVEEGQREVAHSGHDLGRMTAAEGGAILAEGVKAGLNVTQERRGEVTHLADKKGVTLCGRRHLLSRQGRAQGRAAASRPPDLSCGNFGRRWK